MVFVIEHLFADGSHSLTWDRRTGTTHRQLWRPRTLISADHASSTRPPSTQIYFHSTPLYPLPALSQQSSRHNGKEEAFPQA
jgi:hypothetical protein